MLSSPKPSLQNGAETFRTLRTGSPEMFGKEISRWFWDLDHHGEIASRKKIPTLRTGLTYPSPLTDTDRYQMNVFPGRRQWISGVMRHSAGTPSRHCLRVLVRLRVWSKKVFGTSLTGHSHAHPPSFLFYICITRGITVSRESEQLLTG